MEASVSVKTLIETLRKVWQIGWDEEDTCQDLVLTGNDEMNERLNP